MNGTYFCIFRKFMQPMYILKVIWDLCKNTNTNGNVSGPMYIMEVLWDLCILKKCLGPMYSVYTIHIYYGRIWTYVYYGSNYKSGWDLCKL